MSLKDSSTASITDTSKTITGLTNGTKYYFRISALDSMRLESGQSIAVGIVPNASIVPAGLMPGIPSTVMRMTAPVMATMEPITARH